MEVIKGKYYLCKCRLAINGDMDFICKVIGEPYKNGKGDTMVKIISPFAYKEDEIELNCFKRKARFFERLAFLSGKGILWHPYYRPTFDHSTIC